MYEIELKAHVPDKNNCIEKINSFAKYLGTIVKDDEYFQLELHDENGISTNASHLTARLRKESYTFPDGSLKKQELLTYKKKLRKTDSTGAAYEVNEENESEISNGEAVKKLLVDSGYKKAYTKHKDVMQWKMATDEGEAHLELCNIPPLGDFLEIEIVTDSCSNEEKIRLKLKELIVKAGISSDNIEERYYSELLAEAGMIH